MSGFLCEGTLYFERRDANGNSMGLLEMGNATQLAITETTDIKELILKTKGHYGQVGSSVATKKPAKLSVVLNDLRKENLSIALLGDHAAFTQEAATGLTKTFELASAIRNAQIELGKKNIVADSVSVTLRGSMTLVEGTHYVINYDMGWITMLPSSEVSGAVVVTYDCAEFTGYTITGGVNAQIKGKFVLDGINLDDRSRMHLTIWEAVLTPNTPVDFLSDDFVTLGMDGSMNTPTGKASAYLIENYAVEV